MPEEGNTSNQSSVISEQSAPSPLPPNPGDPHERIKELENQLAKIAEDEDDGWHQTEGGTQALEISGLGVIVRCKGYGMLHLPSAKMDKGHIVHIHA